MFAQFVFYVFSVLLLFSASMVIMVRNPVYAALFLVLSFFSMAAIWLLLLAEFLAIVLILVYVGAVMVLFLFVVMLLDINLAVLREGFANYLWIGLLVAALMALIMRAVVGLEHMLPPFATPVAEAMRESNTLALGEALFTDYLYQFEIAGAILLVAIIAAIALTVGVGRKRNKSIDAAVQVQTRKADRLRVVDMPTEQGGDGR